MTPAKSGLPLQNRLARVAWKLVDCVFVRFTPRPFHAWRAFVLRRCGAKLGARCHIYPGAIIWAPWNLECGDDACIASGAEIYNVARVTIGRRAIISQGAYLCAATHDYSDATRAEFPLTSAPIHVGDCAWIAARSIVLPGISIGEGCVIGAGSVVTKDTPPHTVCAGNPCRVIKSTATGNPE
ncbi:MAG: DapH/DapD/GlmU-related protein [Verrucomicrobiota bacterium]